MDPTEANLYTHTHTHTHKLWSASATVRKHQRVFHDVNLLLFGNVYTESLVLVQRSSFVSLTFAFAQETNSTPLLKEFVLL